MSTHIFNTVGDREKDGCSSATRHLEARCYAYNNLAVWHMNQYHGPGFGMWKVCVYLRGLVVCGLAVQDDFGNLQMVEA
jgi:hypothetical protein